MRRGSSVIVKMSYQDCACYRATGTAAQQQITGGENEEKFRTVVIMLAVLSMALGLTACGSSAASKETKAPAAETADEYVYAAEFKTLSEKNEMYFRPSIYTDDGFTRRAARKSGKTFLRALSLNTKGSTTFIRADFISSAMTAPCRS